MVLAQRGGSRNGHWATDLQTHSHPTPYWGEWSWSVCREPHPVGPQSNAQAARGVPGDCSLSRRSDMVFTSTGQHG